MGNEIMKWSGKSHENNKNRRQNIWGEKKPDKVDEFDNQQ